MLLPFKKRVMGRQYNKIFNKSSLLVIDKIANFSYNVFII